MGTIPKPSQPSKMKYEEIRNPNEWCLISLFHACQLLAGAGALATKMGDHQKSALILSAVRQIDTLIKKLNEQEKAMIAMSDISIEQISKLLYEFMNSLIPPPTYEDVRRN